MGCFLALGVRRRIQPALGHRPRERSSPDSHAWRRRRRFFSAVANCGAPRTTGRKCLFRQSVAVRGWVDFFFFLSREVDVDSLKCQRCLQDVTVFSLKRLGAINNSNEARHHESDLY